MTSDDEGVQALEISDLKLEDAAEYKCQIGDRETVAQLAVDEGTSRHYVTDDTVTSSYNVGQN